MEGLRKMALGQPAWTAFVVALVSRLMVVAGSQVTHRWPLIPDEGSYVELAVLANDGRINDFCCGGYGPALYSSSKLFIWQIHGLVALFGPRTWILQLPAVLFGAAGVFIVSRIAGRFVSAKWALFAGLVMAFLPSALLHSSTVLRESLIWALVVGAAWLVIAWTEDSGLGRLVICSAGLLLAVVGLGLLRDQTAVLVAWSLVPVALLVRNQRRERLGLVVILLVVGPWITGTGPAGLQLLDHSFSKLGTIRAWMSGEAESAFVSFDSVEGRDFFLPFDAGEVRARAAEEAGIVPEQTTPPSSVPEVSGTSGAEVGEAEIIPGQTIPPPPRFRCPGGPCSGAQFADGRPSTGAGAVAMALRETTEVVKDGRSLTVVGGNLLVDNSIVANLKTIPNGLAAFYLRPFLWEATAEQSFKLRLASAENILWLLLYGFALFGIRPLWRLHPALLVFVASYFLSVSLGASVTHGNLGTAFRHRLQVLWVVVLLAAIGGEYLWTRRQARRLHRVGPDLLP